MREDTGLEASSVALKAHAIGLNAAPHTAPLRVLYVMEGFDAGGAERRFVRMAQGLNRERFDLRVAALRMGGPLESEMRASGLSIIPLERSGKFDVTPIVRLQRYLRAEGIEVVHSMHWLSNLIATSAASTLPPVGVVGSTVSMVYRAARGGRYRLALDRLLWQRVDHMTVNSASLRDYLVDRGFPAERLSVVHNGVDIPDAERLMDARREARARLGIDTDVPVAGIVARLTPVKDHATFLRAARLVRDRLPSARFVVAGDGPERTALEALAAELHLGDAVLFTGHVQSSDLVLPAFDVAVLTSQHEGMPNALLEAGAWGVPQVATAVGGVPEVVLDGRTGLLASVGDRTALANHMVRLLTDGAFARALGRSTREHIIAGFSTSTMVRRYEQVYSMVAAMRGRPQ